MCCQLEGYKQEQLAFIDSLLKELGIYVLYETFKQRGYSIQNLCQSVSSDIYR